MIYFDTLKVSSMEQAAEETSARGGLGNAEQIIWDYGKEVTVTLQDALLSPASYNLLWGGELSLNHIKVQGFWDSFVYEKDQYGNPQYFKKVFITKEEFDSIQTAAEQAKQRLMEAEILSPNEKEELKEKISLGKRTVSFICPCDNNIKYITYSIGKGKYRCSEWSPNKRNFYSVDENNGHFIGVPLTRQNKDILQQNHEIINIYTIDYFNREVEKEMELAELRLDSFSTFSFHNYLIKENEQNFQITNNEASYFNRGVKDIEHSVLEYDWNDCVAQMAAKGVTKDLAVHENFNLCYQSFYYNNNKRILFCTSQGYESALDFYSIAKKEITTQFGEKRIVEIPILLGTFYIVEDLNIPTPSEEYSVISGNSTIKDIKLLETMNEYEADKAFAIDVDSNIKSYNYSLMPEYSKANLTIFYNPKTMAPYEPNEHSFKKSNGEIIEGNFYVFKAGERYLKYSRIPAPAHQSLGKQIIVTAEKYPGTFKLVGETYIREQDTAKDLNCQIEIPLCKLSSNTNLSLEAAGEPSVVDMSLKVLRPEDGQMVRISFYDRDIKCFNAEKYDFYNCYDILEQIKYIVDIPTHTAVILFPKVNETYCIGKDCRISQKSYESDQQDYTYLRLPNKDEVPRTGGKISDFDYEAFSKEHFNIFLIAEVDENGIIVDYITKDRVSSFFAQQGE